jgi:hypothetical protein
MIVEKKHLYFVPGLAACPKIFEYLKIPDNKYELHFLEWLLPLSENEPIDEYAKRMADLITEENVVLIGVSFGGIMVQEMSKHLTNCKVIIISSVKNRGELPKRLKFIQKTKAYKLFPAKTIQNIEDFSVYAFGSFAKKRVHLYNKYLSVRDDKYLKWAISNVLNWEQRETLSNVIHIHGLNDEVFPSKYLENFVPIENGTHIMILNKANTISEIIKDSI